MMTEDVTVIETFKYCDHYLERKHIDKIEDYEPSSPSFNRYMFLEVGLGMKSRLRAVTVPTLSIHHSTYSTSSQGGEKLIIYIQGHSATHKMS